MTGREEGEKKQTEYSEEKERKSLYWAGWVLLGLGVLYLVLVQVVGSLPNPFALPCPFHFLTGYYCPGCGGTRAVRLLLSGDIPGSVYYHPLVLYGAVLYLWFMISNTIEYASRGTIPIGMRYRRGYVIAGVLILALNFVIKNAALLLWDWHMLD